MNRRLAADGGPVTRNLTQTVTAEGEEDIRQEGRERRRAVVYAAKVRRLTKTVPPRTTAQTRMARQAQEMTASVLAADTARRARLQQRRAGDRFELREYIRRFCTCNPMTLRQHAARKLAVAVMQHEGEGWSTRPGQPLTLPKTWFGREERCRRPPHPEEEEEEAAAVPPPRAAIFQVAMGNCSEEHGRTWAGYWFAATSCGDDDDDPNRLHHGQEGSFSWWGGRGDDTGSRALVRGSLASDFKLLVACHLRGRHLVKFVRSQPGGILGIMQADVGQGRLGVPSQHFFNLLRVILAQAEQYVGAVGHLQGTPCGCDCGSVKNHETTLRALRQELTAFEAAVSGENGILHHALHWHGFTRVLNTLVPTTVPAMRYYRFVLLKGSMVVKCRDPITFRLPYPLDPLLVFPGASRGVRQTYFDAGQEDVWDPIRKLCDRSGYARSDGDRSFSALCGEEQLFRALEVLEASSTAGRHHVTVFMGFWMLTHLSGLLHPPAQSPQFFFRKFKVDVGVRLATSLSAFHFFLDVPLSCLALVEGSSIATDGASRCSNLLANRWQMAVARHEVLVAYGLHREAADLFVKNLGRIPSSSYLYDELVLVHVWSQLQLALDVLLEMYVSLAMHKFCQAANECWDSDAGNRDLLAQTLARLKRTVHGRLAEGSISERLRVNLNGVSLLLPLFEHSTYRLDNNGRRPPLLPVGGPIRPEHNIQQAKNRARDCAFVDAHSAIWDGEKDTPDALLPALYHLTWLPLSIAFSKVVPADGNEENARERYAKFVEKEILGRGASIPKAQTWMRDKGLASADRLYVVTVFFALWQGPTQSDPFWPSWPGHLPPASDVPLDGHLSPAERVRRKAVATLHRVAQKTYDLYKHCSHGRHHRLRLLDRLKEFLPVSRFVSSFCPGLHSNQTANRCVRLEAKNFAYQQSDTHLLAGGQTKEQDPDLGDLLKYAFERDRVLTELVLDYGRQYTRWSSEF